jgi:sulfoxide reductase catalytic subunit YedY
MLIRREPMFRSSEVTPERLYIDRRRFIAGAAALGLAGGAVTDAVLAAIAEGKAPAGAPLSAKRNPAYAHADAITKVEDATTYNNFYEFGLDKGDPARLSGNFKPRPWSVKVEGLVAKPKTYDIDELLKFPLEERVYSLRCVEAWSMIIPWIGFPLSALLKQVGPTSAAKYVEFVTLHDANQFPGQKPSIFGNALNWPYVEGLRLDEAMHPLTLMTVGMYGQVLPNQNGAPFRVIVPWKYGFKSGKSIVRIRVTADQPKTSWAMAAPQEYGFYSNVNPEVSHPRWSQADERRIGEFRRRKTVKFNGYGDQVASLYTGLDLTKNY